MARNYDSVDLDFTWDGDFLLDKQGDLKDTSEDLLLSFKNEIFTIVKSDLTDWREDPSVGADLGDFVGEPNTIDTAKEIQNRVKNSLLLIATESDISVRVVPVGIHRVLVALQVQVLPTAENGLRSGDVATVSFLYDYFERGIFTPLEEMNKFGGRVL
jgi:hypothetical protein